MNASFLVDDPIEYGKATARVKENLELPGIHVSRSMILI